MAEEFIDDIIANTETETTDTVSDSKESEGKEPEIIESNKDDDTETATETESSTPPETDHIDETDSEESAEKDVAPTGLADVEDLAAQLGWNKDHKGADVVDAATYILRSKDIQKTMKDHNKDLKSQLNVLQDSVKALKEHNDRVYQVEIRKLQTELNALQKEKRAAVELADVDKVEEIDQQIENIKKDIDVPKAETSSTNNLLYDEWVADNSWYLTEPEMAAYADRVAEQYEGAPPARIYALVRTKVMEVFPDKFETGINEKVLDTANTVAKKASDKKVIAPQSPVEKGSRNGDNATFTKADLSPEQVNIMNQFVRSGIMTEEQYIADIEKLQGA